MGRRTNAQIAADNMRVATRDTLLLAALDFVDLTVAEMNSLDGTQSASAPAEFMALHDAAEKYRAALERWQESRQHGESRAAS